jgi:hypothetical protein
MQVSPSCATVDAFSLDCSTETVRLACITRQSSGHLYHSARYVRTRHTPKQSLWPMLRESHKPGHHHPWHIIGLRTCCRVLERGLSKWRSSVPHGQDRSQWTSPSMATLLLVILDQKTTKVILYRSSGYSRRVIKLSIPIRVRLFVQNVCALIPYSSRSSGQVSVLIAATQSC